MCPIETGEGMSAFSRKNMLDFPKKQMRLKIQRPSGAGIVQAMAANARITEDGELQVRVGHLSSLNEMHIKCTYLSTAYLSLWVKLV